MFDWMDPKFSIITAELEDREFGELAIELQREGIVLEEFAPFSAIDIHHADFPSGLLLRLYNAEEVVDRYFGYQINEYLPGFFPVADDAGDQVLLQPRTAPSRLCYTGYGALFADELTDLATDLRSFLTDPVGLSDFYGWPAD